MRKITILGLWSCLIISSPSLATVMIEDHLITAAVVNRTETVIRYMLNDSGVWTGLTHATTAHPFWATSPSIIIKIQALPNGGRYMTVCPEIQYLNANETISVLARDPQEGSGFYCEVKQGDNLDI